MRILILHKWLVIGGVETVLNTYCDILRKLGYQVDLLITYGPKDRKDSVDNIYVYPYEILEKRLSFSRLSKKSLMCKLKYELLKLYLDTKYSLLVRKASYKYNYVIDFSGCLDKYIRNPFHSYKSRNTIRWVHGQLNGSSPVTLKQVKKFKNIFRNHGKVITICPEMTERIKDILDIDGKNFLTIFNPINIDLLREKALEPISLNKFIPPPYLLQVSRLVNGKGHEELLEVFSKLKQNDIPHKLCIIGDGENREILEKKVKSLKLDDEVIFLGAIENPYPYFKNATLFLHTSEHEGLPTVLLESMVFGVPVVSMDCPTGPKDILGINSEFGKLVPLHDKEQFVSETLKLLTSSNLYSYYSQKSLERIKDFSIEKITSDLRNLFENNEDE